MLFSRLHSLLSLCALATAAALGPSNHLLAAHTIFQLNQTGTWLENIAVRANGDLLVTMLSPTPSLYTLKRPYSPTRAFSLMHTFTNASGLLGIAEIEPDTFAVLSVQFTPEMAPVPGSSTIWGVSLQHDSTPPRVWRIAKIPNITVPNGLAFIPGSSTLFVSDSFGGTISRCDARTGQCSVIINGPETVPLEGSSTGVNGVRYHAGYLYWSHSGLAEIFRVRVGLDGCLPADAKIESVGRVDAVFIDDFAVDKAGTAWIAAGLNNTIIALREDGESEVVAGSQDELTLAGPTSAAFGRTGHDKKTLYVVTNGGAQSLAPEMVEPAKIVAVDTAGYI
ncbi:hypothetical protein F4777DRAFT_562716 [Nemania sp. FL0916]|nr:hypothetical protein F4777DRAFT_562716 [Nemania sp. FL0916]